MASSLERGRGNGKAGRAPGEADRPDTTRGPRRSPTSSACVGVFIGAAAALVPASCSSGLETSAAGGGGGSGGAGGMTMDAGDETDGTLVDLDGDADSPHIPPDSGKPDSDVS